MYAECHKIAFMLSILMLLVVMLSVVMLNVVAPGLNLYAPSYNSNFL